MYKSVLLFTSLISLLPNFAQQNYQDPLSTTNPFDPFNPNVRPGHLVRVPNGRVTPNLHCCWLVSNFSDFIAFLPHNVLKGET